MKTLKIVNAVHSSSTLLVPKNLTITSWCSYYSSDNTDDETITWINTRGE